MNQMTNWAKCPRNMATVAVWKPRSLTSAPGSTGDSTRFSTQTSPANTIGVKTSRVMTTGDVHPMAWPSRKPIMKHRSSASTNAAPQMSNVRLAGSADNRPGTASNPVANASAASGMRPAYTACHP